MGNKTPRAVVAGDALTYHFSLGTDPARADTDGDGLNDNAELDAGLDPNNPDCDGDALPDGWEMNVGLDPFAPNDPFGDEDEDGLTDYEEGQWGTNPYEKDSDGDGVDDALEVDQNSDPADASDEGKAGSFIKARFTFGDPSGSESERYVVEVRQIVGQGSDGAPKRLENLISNGVETREVLLRPDSVYEVTFHHLDSTQDTPDLDYDLLLAFPTPIVGKALEPSTWNGTIKVVDRDGLLGSFGDDKDRSFEGKKLSIYTINSMLIPDYNRDGVIDQADERLARMGQKLPIWVNADDDDGTGVNKGDDTSALWGWQDCTNTKVDGISDVEDFFPVKLILGEAARQYLEDQRKEKSDLTVALISDDTLGIVWCDGGDDMIGHFYEADESTSDRCFGDGTESRWEASVVNPSKGFLGISSEPVPGEINDEMLRGERGEMFFFVEGYTEGENTLRICIQERRFLLQDNPVFEETDASLTFDVHDIEDFYTKIDLRNDETSVREALSVLQPDSMDTLYFLHGYGVSEEGADAWFATMFKRFWQSGMNARFCGITWESDDELLIPKYYANVENAFVAAGRLSAALRGREGRKVVMAHSLGNMVVSSAIQDHGAPVDVYFMLNSAVPAEAYDTDVPTYDFTIKDVPGGLIHDDWDAYPPKSYAALWYRHFLPHEGFVSNEVDEARAQLTWKGRFKDVIGNRGVEVYNYYSAGEGSDSGDEVLELTSPDPKATTGFEWFGGKGRFSWQKQELCKGRERNTESMLEGFVSSDTMGWGFELKQYGGQVSVATVNGYDEKAFREHPIFWHNPPEILGPDASAILIQRDHLLAQAIPALSQATGKSKVSGVKGSTDLQDFVTEFKETWPRKGNSEATPSGRWLHSDIKDVAYPFTKDLFLELIEMGNLK